LLQPIMLTVVTGSGSTNELRFVDAAVIEAMTGAVMGAIAMAATGLALNGTAAKSRTDKQSLTQPDHHDFSVGILAVFYSSPAHAS
jgi:hypothetical protein